MMLNRHWKASVGAADSNNGTCVELNICQRASTKGVSMILGMVWSHVNNPAGLECRSCLGRGKNVDGLLSLECAQERKRASLSENKRHLHISWRRSFILYPLGVRREGSICSWIHFPNWTRYRSEFEYVFRK